VPRKKMTIQFFYFLFSLRSTPLLVPVMFVMLYNPCWSQDVPVIKVQRSRPLTFFQQGVKRDTISKDRGDVFYLFVPDSLIPILSIRCENGRFDPAGSDTSIKLTFIPGHRYESFFERVHNKGPEPGRGKLYVFRSVIDGASDLTENAVHILFYDKRTGKKFLENRFLFVRKP
jgi:hypothetical protein